MKIKGYLHGGNHRGGYVYFDVLDKVPEVGDEYRNETVTKVFEACLDPEQDGDEIYSYDCYKIITDDVDCDGNHDETEWYIAVSHEYEEEKMKWFESDIDIVEIDGNLYALNGWDGEKWAHCWRCLDENTAADEDCAYEIAPVYDMDAWNEEDGEFQDADGNAINGIIGYEVL